MAEKRRFLDVWIIEANTVYREVPFTVVVDWVQEGRLLENDMLRYSGTAEWFRVGGSADFNPYVPRSEPMRVDDQAEALEPVEFGFSWRRHPEDEDDDVDMIPLIDVSLVLLIFFMMITAGVSAAASIQAPAAEMGEIANDPQALRLDIDLPGEGKDRAPVFALGLGTEPPTAEDQNLPTLQDLLKHLRDRLGQIHGRVDVTINAHEDVKSGLVHELTTALQTEPYRGKIAHVYTGIRDQQP